MSRVKFTRTSNASRVATLAHGPLVRSPVFRRHPDADLRSSWHDRHACRSRADADHRAYPRPAPQPVAVRTDASGPRVPARVVPGVDRRLLSAADDVSAGILPGRFRLIAVRQRLKERNHILDL